VNYRIYIYSNFYQRGEIILRKLSAWLCIVGGLLWGLKPVYDWLILDRRINTGYSASDFTDYIKFIFPLLCLGGVFVLFSLYKKRVRNAAIILVVAILLNSLFHFFEIYFTDSSIPFGLLFMFSGVIFLLIGGIFLAIQLKGDKHIPRSLRWCAEALFVTNLLFLIFPFVSGMVPDVILTPIMVGLMVLVGFTWAAIGTALVKLVK